MTRAREGNVWRSLSTNTLAAAARDLAYHQPEDCADVIAELDRRGRTGPIWVDCPPCGGDGGSCEVCGGDGEMLVTHDGGIRRPTYTP